MIPVKDYLYRILSTDVTGSIARNGGNIVYPDQYVDTFLYIAA